MPVLTRVLLVAAGALIAIAGIIFTLQGLGYVGGSFMTGATAWAIIGPVIALAGLALIGLTLIGLTLIAAGLLRRRVPGRRIPGRRIPGRRIPGGRGGN
jgi:hypothetical protein